LSFSEWHPKMSENPQKTNLESEINFKEHDSGFVPNILKIKFLKLLKECPADSLQRKELQP
jgi:hypothetical protein